MSAHQNIVFFSLKTKHVMFTWFCMFSFLLSLLQMGPNEILFVMEGVNEMNCLIYSIVVVR